MRSISFLLFLMFILCAPVATWAQDESASSYFRHDRDRQNSAGNLVQKPTHLIRRAKPVRGFTLDNPLDGVVDPWGVPNAVGASERPDGQNDARREARDVDQGPHIAIVGDSLAQDLARGLSESFAERHDVTLLKFLNPAARLGRDEAGDAGSLLRDVLTSKTRVDVVIVMLGLNDMIAGRDQVVSVGPDNDPMRVLGTRAAIFVRQLKMRKIDVIWVGVPIVKSERLANDVDALNGIVHEQVSAAQGVFIDVWDGFQDDRGLYSAYGPDIGGQFRKMRLVDGVHFTRAGARTFAYFVEGDLRMLVDVRRGVEPVIVPSAPDAPNPQASVPDAPAPDVRNSDAPRPTNAPVVVRESFGVMVPLPPPIGEAFIPVRPAAGQVMPLNRTAMGMGGQLIAPRHLRQKTNTGNEAADRVQREADRVLDQVFGEGRVREPRSGRTDDFSWPRRAN